MIGSAHERLVHRRRVRILADRIAALLPQNALVLDVGCGDGRIGRRICERRPDVQVVGLERRARPETAIRLVEFDGARIPFATDAFDVAVLVDVVHHAREPLALLAEARRVAKSGVIVKDHVPEGLLATPTLRLMDWAGNARHGVELPTGYWPRARWEDVFGRLHLRIDRWDDRLGLYPFPASLVFERSLHFLALLRRNGPEEAVGPAGAG